MAPLSARECSGDILEVSSSSEDEQCGPPYPRPCPTSKGPGVTTGVLDISSSESEVEVLAPSLLLAASASTSVKLPKQHRAPHMKKEQVSPQTEKEIIRTADSSDRELDVRNKSKRSITHQGRPIQPNLKRNRDEGDNSEGGQRGNDKGKKRALAPHTSASLRRGVVGLSGGHKGLQSTESTPDSIARTHYHSTAGMKMEGGLGVFHEAGHDTDRVDLAVIEIRSHTQACEGVGTQNGRPFAEDEPECTKGGRSDTASSKDSPGMTCYGNVGDRLMDEDGDAIMDFQDNLVQVDRFRSFDEAAECAQAVTSTLEVIPDTEVDYLLALVTAHMTTMDSTRTVQAVLEHLLDKGSDPEGHAGHEETNQLNRDIGSASVRVGGIGPDSQTMKPKAFEQDDKAKASCTEWGRTEGIGEEAGLGNRGADNRSTENVGRGSFVAEKEEGKGSNIKPMSGGLDCHADSSLGLTGECVSNGGKEGSSKTSVVDDGGLVECACCYAELPFELMSQCNEAHLFCHSCIRRYAGIQLGEGNTRLACMHISGCEALLPVGELRRLLPANVFALYERLEQQKELAEAKVEGLEGCPFCDWACIPSVPKEDHPLLQCGREECGIVSCRLCRKKEHVPFGCENMHTRERIAIEEAMSEALMRSCPKCQKRTYTLFPLCIC